MGVLGRDKRASRRKILFSGKKRKSAFLVSELLDLVTLSVLIIATIWAIASEVAFLATTAHFLEARMLASAVAGAVTAVSSAPQAGIYCLTLPGTFSYDIAIGTDTIESTSGPPLEDVPPISANPPEDSYCPSLDSGHYSSYSNYLNEYKALFDSAAEKYDVPLPYILAIAHGESGVNHFDPTNTAKDPNGLLHGEGLGSGYCGIMSAPCDTYRTPEENIDYGVGELKKKMDFFGGDFQLAVGAYSGGTAGMTGYWEYELSPPIDINEDGDELDWIPGYVESLGGYNSWIKNIADSEFLELDIFKSTNEILANLGLTMNDGSAYTVEKQNACAVYRTTSAARYFEGLGLGKAKYGFTAVLRRDDRTGSTFYLPVSNMEPAVFHIPKGGKYTLVLKKSIFKLPQGNYMERISFSVKKGGLREAGCNADTPALCAF